MSLIDENVAGQAYLDWFEALGYARVFCPGAACLGDGCCRQRNDGFRTGNTP